MSSTKLSGDSVKRYIFWIGIFGIFLLMSYPGSIMSVDDYNYAFICDCEEYLEPTGDVTPMTSISEIIPSQVYHYMHVNGRFVAHVLVQLFVNFLGYDALTLVKGILATLMLWLLCQLTLSAGQELSVRRAVIVFSLFMIVMPYYFFMDMFGYAAVVFNYLLGAVSMLAGLLIYFRLQSSEKIFKWYELIAMFLFSAIIGSIHEGFCVPAGAAIFILSCFNWTSIKRRTWFFSFGYWLGNLALLLSPGSWGRLQGGDISLKAQVFSRLFGVILFNEWLIPLTALALVLLGLLLSKRYSNIVKKVFRRCTPFLLVIFFNVAFCLAAGSFGLDRIFQPVGLMVIVIFTILMAKASSKIDSERMKKVVTMAFAIVGIALVVSFTVEGFENRAEYVRIESDYVNSPIGLVSIDDEYPRQHWGSHYDIFNPAVPSPSGTRPDERWSRSKMPFYYSDQKAIYGYENVEKPLRFSPHLDRLVKENIVWENDSLKLYAHENAWWIVLEGTSDTNVEIVESEWELEQAHRRILCQYIHFLKDLTHGRVVSRFNIDGRDYIVAAHRDDARLTEVKIMNDTLVVATVKLP